MSKLFSSSHALSRRLFLAGGAGGVFVLATGMSRPPEAAGGDVFVHPDGDDRDSGSERRPWRSVGRVSRAALLPGQRVFFARGGRWSGETLVLRSGVAYLPWPGEGPLPELTGMDGPGVVFPEGAAGAWLEGFAIIRSGKGGVWIDKAGPGNAVIGCRLRENVADHSRTCNIAGYHTPELTIAGCDLADTNGDDHIYLYNCPKAVITDNRIEWRGPQDGDCIHVSNCDDFLIARNELIFHAGGKGCVMVSPVREDQRPGVIEDNLVTGGQYGISPRVSGCRVRRNLVRRVGLQEDARSWSSGIWIATGGHPLNAHDIEITDCVIEDCPRAVFGWDDLEARTTRLTLSNCLIANARQTYFGHDNGRLDARVHNNIVIASGPRTLYSERAFVRFQDNHFHKTEGEAEDGPPGLGRGFHVPAGARASGCGPREPLRLCQAQRAESACAPVTTSG